jgi:uncharacterized protein YukE
MATNVDFLREGLKDYIKSLHNHNNTLHADFHELSVNFTAMQQAYEGQAAETFKASWLVTARWFEEYIEETVRLIQFLESRVTWLEQEK